MSWLSVLLGLVGLTVAMALGIFFFTFFMGIVLVAAAVLGVRVWWIRRRILKQGLGAGFPGGPTMARSDSAGRGATLEGEYQVLDSGDGEADQRGGGK